MTYNFHICALSNTYEKKDTQAKAKQTPKKWIFEYVIYRSTNKTSTMLLILPFTLSMLSFLQVIKKLI